MAKIEEEDIEIPGDEDENVGGEGQKKKRVKRKKSKEERIAERKVIFWTLIIILVATLSFWFVPRIEGIFRGEPLIIESNDENQAVPSKQKTESKNYVEIRL